MFRAIVFATFACGFRPRSARELDDSGFARLDKILAIIEECRYGIHDISRTELDSASNLPRFNMPFELGLFIAAKRFGGGDHGKKRTLVMDIEAYRYQKFLSDLNGMDIASHGGDPEIAVTKIRNWLANVSRRQLASGNRVVTAYRNFTNDFPRICALQDFDLGSVPYIDFERIVTDWLLTGSPELRTP